MNEEIVEQIREIVKELPFDLRAEVVASYMRSHGINMDDIILSPLGLFKRKFNSDVHDIVVLDTKSGKQYVQLKLNREGIYDGLPQALTHSVKKGRRSGIKNTSEMIDEVKVRRQEEKAARTFFQPFENEFYQQQVELEIEEQNILRGYNNNSRYSALLNDFWQLPESLDVRQKSTFIYLIPIIHKAAGDLQLTKLCYEEILGLDVNFKISYDSTKETVAEYSLSDKKLTLGVNSVLGKRFYYASPFLEIIIGPVKEEQIPNYLPEGRGRAVIEFLNGYFLEVGLSTKITVRKIEDNQDLIFNNFRLGYSILTKPMKKS